MKPIGSDGEPIPVPPDPRSAEEVLGANLRVWLTLAAWLLAVIGLLLLFSHQPLARFGWSETALRFLIVIGGVSVVAVGFNFVGAFFSFLSLPFKSRAYGSWIERRMARMTPTQVDQDISHAREVLRDLRDARKIQAWTKWLDWLESLSVLPLEERREPLEATYRPTKASLVWAGVFTISIWGGGAAWAFLKKTDTGWGTLLFLGTVALILTGSSMFAAASRVELTPDQLEFYTFGRKSWSVPRRHVATRENGKDSCDYDVFDVRTGKLLGEIKGSIFGTDAVEALMDNFPPFPQSVD